jgi:putative multiple sugar transport system substrate-binding protein
MFATTAGVEVGIVLPTSNEPRWIQDQTRFEQALKTAGYNAEILFSQGEPARERANVEALITKGAKVLIICPQDAAAAAVEANEAHRKHVKVISYDRLIRDTASVDYFVTFDSVQVGAAWGKYLVSKAHGKNNNLYLYAGAPSDNNAFLFFEGAWSALQPKIADGTFVVRNSNEAINHMGMAKLTREEMGRIIGQVTTNWNFSDAKRKAEANLSTAKKTMKGTVYICGPNDGMARAIADVFAVDKDVKTYYITGQDAEKASIQYIIDGKQSMTVLKDVRSLATDAIAAAVAYLKGGVPAKTAVFNNGRVDVPAKPTAIVTVTKENIKTAIVGSGYYAASEFKGLK